MTFEQLLYVEVLSHYRSLQEAADVLHITKSGLSLAISQLEQELGMQLFERTKKGTRLTQEGIQLMSRITNILQSKTAFENEIAALSGKPVNSVVKIEYVNTMLKPFMQEFIRHYQKKYAGVMLDIVCNDMHSIIQRVRQGVVDAGFIAYRDEDRDLMKDLIIQPACYGKVILTVSADNDLVNQPITLEALKKQRFCLYKDSFHDDLIDRLQFMCGPLDIVLRTDDSWAMRQAITELNAVCFGRSTQWELSRESVLDDMIAIDVGHLFNDNVTMGWVLNPRTDRSSSVYELVGSITKEMQKEKRQ